jgi:hypothetical protein
MPLSNFTRLDARVFGAGTKMHIGSPTIPMSPELSVAIAGMLEEMPGVLEAHLPQCYAPGVIDPPAQVLMIVLSRSGQEVMFASEVRRRLLSILPKGVPLEFMFLHRSSPELESVRRANCRIR